MWKLVVREGKGRKFATLGSYASLGEAAQVIVETEGDRLATIFFRVYIDPSGHFSDAEALSRFEYQSARRFYLLTRIAH